MRRSLWSRRILPPTCARGRLRISGGRGRCLQFGVLREFGSASMGCLNGSGVMVAARGEVAQTGLVIRRGSGPGVRGRGGGGRAWRRGFRKGWCRTRVACCFGGDAGAEEGGESRRAGRCGMFGEVCQIDGGEVHGDAAEDGGAFAVEDGPAAGLCGVLRGSGGGGELAAETIGVAHGEQARCAWGEWR